MTTNQLATRSVIMPDCFFPTATKSLMLTNASFVRATGSLIRADDTFTRMHNRLILNHHASPHARMHQWRVSLSHSHARATDPLRITCAIAFPNSLTISHRVLRGRGSGSGKQATSTLRMFSIPQLTSCPSRHRQAFRSAKRLRLQDAHCIFPATQFVRRSPP